MKHQFYVPYFLSISHVFLDSKYILGKKGKNYSLFCPSLPALLPPLLMPCWMLYSAHQLTALVLHTSPDLNPLIPIPSPFQGPCSYTERWFCYQMANHEAGDIDATQQNVQSATWLSPIQWQRLLHHISMRFCAAIS